ncbi:MAG TPA: hypothetical protein VF773_10600 [Verrucomicrobiae bacterium]
MNTLRMIRFAALGLVFGATLLGAETSLEVISKPQNARPSSFGDSGELEFNYYGDWAVFTSSGNGLVTNDHNGFHLDVFLRNNKTGEITLVSKAMGGNGRGGNGNSFTPQVYDGPPETPSAWVVIFESEASDLVPGDTNGVSDIFRFDRIAGEISILSTNLQGGVLGGPSGAAVSWDGSNLIFETLASLYSMDTNNSVDLYRVTLKGGVELVSVQSNNLAAASVPFASEVIGNFAASADGAGRYVAFVSSGTNHVAGSPAGTTPVPPPQIYLRDMLGGTNVWLTRSTNGGGAALVGRAEVTRDGDKVVFLSSSILPVGTTPPVGAMFLYVYDVTTGGRTELLTPTLIAVEEFALSGDGSYVAYASSNQIYLRDLAGTTNILVSRSAGGQPASGISTDAAISADGRYVVFTSTATNLAGAPADELFQTYRFDRETGEVVLMSRAAGPEVGGADEDTLFPVISGDGSMIGFHSYAGNLVTNDNEFSNDVFIVPNNATGAVVLASSPHPLSVPGTASGQSFVEHQAISLDGRFVIFSSDADDLVEGDEDEARDLFLRDRVAGTTELISFLPDGSEQTEPVTFVGASRDAGRIAYYVSEMVTNVVQRSAYVYERATGSNTLVSVLPTGSPVGTSGPMLLSPDGRHFVFRDIATSSPIYIYNLDSNVTAQYSPPATAGQFPIGREPLAISPHGKYLLTRNTPQSVALHLLEERRFVTNVSTYLISDWFTLDETVLLTEVPFPAAAQPTLEIRALDGSATNLVATNANALAMSLNGSAIAYRQRRDGTNFVHAIFNTRDRSHSEIPFEWTTVGGRIRYATFSADGRYLALVTTNSLVGSVDHSFNKIYIYDTVLKTFRAAGVNAAGEPAEFGLGNPSISASGNVLVFDTFSANLATNDLNISSDVFVSRFAAVDSDADGLEDGWETIYFGGLTNSWAADADADGVSNWNEFVAGSDPSDASSRLVLMMERDEEAGTLVITAAASFGKTYVLEGADVLAGDDWEAASEPQVALGESVTFEAAIADGNRFFRVAPVP